MRRGIKEAIDVFKVAKEMGLIEDIMLNPIYYIDGMLSHKKDPVEQQRPNVKVVVEVKTPQVAESLMHYILDNYKSESKKMQVYINMSYMNCLVIECLFSDLEEK